MGSVDISYLRRFGELPFDTLESLITGGFSRQNAYAVMNHNIKIVCDSMREEKQAKEKEAQQRLFRDCPFCQLPPT
ncbi:hypothetical protein EDD76_103170 [Kineothrix alysoides]|uniref:Uncharacterized protein n=2 Tax=Kineothrix alysoides TaxID=1469948 RepID=A0A4R1R3J8_9FIRM|nr:hypothetical protein EDD76_103170 [Kineothrix alysoides]